MTEGSPAKSAALACGGSEAGTAVGDDAKLGRHALEFRLSSQ